MASYHYEAMSMTDRRKVSGVINALSEKEAREYLREQDLLPTKLRLVKGKVDAGAGVKKFDPIAMVTSLFAGVGAKEKITFTRNIGMMVKAGIPLTEALSYFETYVSNPGFRGIVSKIRTDILAGMSFSQALSKHPKLFNDVYVSVTKAGESSGELDETMARLTDLLVKAEKLKMKVISAAVYPIIILVIVAIVLLIMFVLVIPTFVEIYKRMGIDLPWPTQVMFEISHYLKDYWFVSFPLMGVAAFTSVKYLRSPMGKRMLDRLFLRIPVLNELVIYTQNTQFISTFYVAFSAGVAITDALYLAVQTVTNVNIRKAFDQITVEIQAGQRLGPALSNTGFVPSIVLLMISSGEEAGNLDKMLQRSFEYLEEEVNHKVEILTSMMEPIMLMFVGVIVGFVAMSIYLPLFSMYENIGK
ncbi:MAG: type II secretion system F family protein [Candidatus Melainabacteria bacterium]